MLVEDIDDVEARRRALKDRDKRTRRAARGTLEDPDLWKRLLGFLRPHAPAVLGALLLSALAAGWRVGFLFVVEQILKPMFEQGVDVSGPRHRLVLAVWPGEPSVLDDARALFAALRWRFEVLPPLTRLGWSAVGVVLLVTLEQFTKYGQKLLMRGVSLESVRDVRIALFGKLMHYSMRFHRANHSGKLLSRLTADLTKLGNAFVDFMVNVLSDLFTTIGTFWFVYSKGGPSVLLALFVALVVFVPVQRLGSRIRSREEKSQRQMGNVFLSLAEALRAQKIVKAFGAERRETERFRRANDQYTAGRMRSVELQARTEPLVECFGALGVALFLYLGGRQVIAGTSDGPAFFTVILALFVLVASLRRLSGTFTRMQAGLSSADRVATMLYGQPDLVDSPTAVELSGFERAIEYDHVWFAHEEGRWAIRDVSFALPKGATLALVGHTGSGKSTLGDLLARFYDVDRGAVRIDGHDVRDVTQASLRRLVAVVTQETVLFQGTVASNIAYGRPDASRDEVERAARAAHAHEFVERLPQGYDTPVGEGGMTLSGGERQRLAIARALLRNAPILVLDEATSALDSRSERLVQEAIEALKHGRTTLVIAHRLSTIRDAEQILVVEHGRIVEQGRHDALMAADGPYARMVRLQHGLDATLPTPGGEGAGAPSSGAEEAFGVEDGDDGDEVPGRRRRD